MNRSPEMIRVPKELLDDLESGFVHLHFMANRVATEIAKGAKPKPLARVLRQEAERALTIINKWRKTRWKVEKDAGQNAHQPAHGDDAREADR